VNEREAAGPAAASSIIDRIAADAGPPDVLAHAVAPEAVDDLIVYLVSDAAALASGAIVPAHGA
jgi:hypothetical protein